MCEIIDVHDLPEEDVKKIQDYVEQLRKKNKKLNLKSNNEDLTLRSWPMSAKGTFSRKDLYEDC